MGSGTTGMVAKQLGRDYIGCELNEEYGKLIQQTCDRLQSVHYGHNRLKYPL